MEASNWCEMLSVQSVWLEGVTVGTVALWWQWAGWWMTIPEDEIGQGKF